MSAVYRPSERAPSSRASSRRSEPPPPYSMHPPSHASHPRSCPSSRHSSLSQPPPSDRSSPSTSAIREGPPTTPCPCPTPINAILPTTHASALHLAQHLVSINPTNAQATRDKLRLINHVRSLGVDCTDFNLSHWGPLKPNPDRHKIPDMQSWTVRAQMNYYLNDFANFEKDATTAQPPSFWREAIDTYNVMARCFETMGCMACQHHLKLGGGAAVEANMAVFDKMKACHDRRTGHRYAGGCCGNGAYLVDGAGMEMVETAESTRSAPRERLVFRDGSGVGGGGGGAGSRSAKGESRTAGDGKTVYLPGSYVSESRRGSARSGSRKDSQAGSAHSSHRSGRSKYDRSEASGWIKPTARSEMGVPASVAGSGRSEGNTSSILPGESSSGYAERQGDGRRKGIERR
ncbi:hypothetical protein LTR70_007954 [Exophiala xenobiotica]|nr:hypothetical protein LTR70_007954 [Exophiala xenobiotica]